ncbi:hypothetical protein QYE76_050757 [Lolium multiflorum]|uniref:DDE Tnp4 domain-containing protein n=1 Tax=Lolium multiflorum TaxID=4521 RepID=A0AAD8SSI4_LOLMU|nr:hypothetical protein QYE76_050757 [Lolium multiflorum]
MKNLSHVGSNYYFSTTNNMADDRDDLYSLYWSGVSLTPRAVSESVPVVEAGNRVVDDGVFKGMERNGVVEGVEKNGAELIAGAEEDRSNEEYGGFEFHMPPSGVGFEMSNTTGAEWMQPPGSKRQRLLSGSTEFASGGSAGDRSMFVFQMVGVEALPQAGMVNKSGADGMGGAPAAPRGSKRKLPPSGSTETARGGSNGGGGNDGSDKGKAKLVSAKEEDGEWWETVGSPWYPAADFKRHFHLSRSTFEALCGMVAPAVEKQDTRMRIPIPVRKRVAVVVFLLSTGQSLRMIEKRFGIGISTVHKLVREVCAAITDIVLPQFVVWPDASTAASAAAKFKALTEGIPDVIGAVYTTHIHIKAPEHHVADYYNAGLTRRNKGKTSYSVSLQASVDADGAITDVCVGHPGAVPDGDVLFKSTLMTRTVDILSQDKRLIGGAGYPLMDWMLVPYSHQNLTHTQHEFNLKVAAARAVAVDAFQRLKTRWACLQKRCEFKVKNIPAILSACCALHNFCERCGDELDHELPRFQLVDDDVVAPNPVSSAAAAQMRDAMANNLLY